MQGLSSPRWRFMTSEKMEDVIILKTVCWFQINFAKINSSGDNFFVDRSHQVVEFIHDKKKMDKIKEKIENRNERERLKDKKVDE